MNEATEQSRALTNDEWRTVFFQGLKDDGVAPFPFEDEGVDLSRAATGIRCHLKTMAIDPRDAVQPAMAKAYCAAFRAEAAKGRALPPGVIQSFLRLGEVPPVPGLKETAS